MAGIASGAAPQTKLEVHHIRFQRALGNETEANKLRCIRIATKTLMNGWSLVGRPFAAEATPTSFLRP
jgi:hypothetical protein